MSCDVWIGALVSIPIGIATSLVVPPIQNAIGRFGVKSRTKRTEGIRKEYEKVLYFCFHRELLAAELIQRLFVPVGAIFVLIIIHFVMSISSGRGALAILDVPIDLHDHRFYGALVFGLLILTSVLLTLAVVQSSIVGGLILYARVTKPGRYFESVPAEVRDHNREASIMNDRLAVPLP